MGITKKQVATLVHSMKGNRYFQHTLEEATTPSKLLFVLGQYVQFNAPFAAGVAALAGAIAFRRRDFICKNEKWHNLADRSFEIAACVYRAAIDEFGDRETTKRLTHRTLAQNFLRQCAGFFQKEPDEHPSLFSNTEETTKSMGEVRRYYSGIDGDEKFPFFSLGFHIGSEFLADEEFGILDDLLRRKYPKLVKFLEKKGAYHWVQIHTHVEADHFREALRGANMAAELFSPPYECSESTCRDWILEGCKRFAEIQHGFMSSLRGSRTLTLIDP